MLFVFRIIYTSATKAINAISEINLVFLLISLLFFIFFFFLRSYLWKLILGERGNQFSFKENALHLSTSELKRYVPGNIWAFMARTAVFEKDNLPKKEIVSFIIKEAIVLSLSSLILSLIFLFYFENNYYLKYGVFVFVATASFIFIFHKTLAKLVPNGILKSTFYLFIPNYSVWNNLIILLWAILTFFIFGLGTYFSIFSIFYLDPRNLLSYVGLFSFSFFVGYVSFITPMGIGVREGTMTYTLATFIGTSAAAIGAIFTRVILIISELISLVLIILLNKIKGDLINNIEKFVFKNKYLITLIFLIGLYVIYYTTASFFRYDNFYTGRFDLGNMDQTVWNTINGRIFQLTNPDGIKTIYRLAFHSDFILILIAPLYLIWENPKMLLLFHTIILSLGALYVYAISNVLLKNKAISLIFSASYLLNPAVGFVNLYDFHPVALATTFLLASYYYFLKRNYILLTFFLILSAFTKEEVWTLVSIFGLFILIRSFYKKTKNNILEKIYGFILLIIGIPIAYILIDKIIPLFRGQQHFALEYYSDFGTSTLEVIKNVLLNPVKLFARILEGNRLEFLMQLFLPLGFLSIVAPFTLIFALPDLFISLLSSNAALHQIYYQYTSVITPFIFISAIYSSLFLIKKINKINAKYLSLYILFFTILAQYLTGPLPGSTKPNIDMFTKQLENRKEIDNFLNSIPQKYSVAATNNAGSHLSEREHIYTLPIGMKEADYIIFLVDHGWAAQPLEEQKKTINELIVNDNFNLVFQKKNFFAFKRAN
ncbi:MAG: hypothetical protein A3B38_01415 [Candidatus Levybacteria bacterium RIFCSPLOWO2_01_FULL_36_13]|nr:MAG: hypothetical protein A2684_02650 [Candidatus Levybacteria bacterium RIFCSPHIGHO2_01_FULL_36_15b]OGH35532.1 MAG: hypothetical protein A3B38_01415 [Candidatus Levybacteria bacterium RIFCSPLOWO2_01_FULL_36_13]